MKKLIPLLLLMLMACEKEVNLNLSSGASRLVVDGQIESGGYPVVILTKSVGYFSTIDLETMESSFVHDALVRITDGIDTVTLREYSLDTGLLGASQFYLYTVDTGDFQALQFTGKTEGTYTLLIEHEGNIYSSSTKIPNVDPVDSIWVRPPAGEPVVPTAMMLFIRYKVPDTLGNYVRYFTQRNNELFLPGIYSVYSDEFINGTVIDSLFISAGHNRGRRPNLDSLGYFFRGDTVTLRWSAIDQKVYDFYRSFEYAIGTVGNPFAAPVNVETNISGGALGVWAGYGSTYSTIVISP